MLYGKLRGPKQRNTENTCLARVGQLPSHWKTAPRWILQGLAWLLPLKLGGYGFCSLMNLNPVPILLPSTLLAGLNLNKTGLAQMGLATTS